MQCWTDDCSLRHPHLHSQPAVAKRPELLSRPDQLLTYTTCLVRALVRVRPYNELPVIHCMASNSYGGCFQILDHGKEFQNHPSERARCQKKLLRQTSPQQDTPWADQPGTCNQQKARTIRYCSWWVIPNGEFLLPQACVAPRPGG
jgi:hypothetical protein